MKRIISMSIKETERIRVLEALEQKRIKQKHAARQLNISVRQVRRLLKRYRREGALGLVHKSRGRTNNRAFSENKRTMITDIITKHYHDFGPTLACEKLAERHEIVAGVETIRQLMIGADIWKPKRRKVVAIHPYRPRRSCRGELVQLDGSPHAWFEDRGEPCTLIAFIDDATSSIMDGIFVDFEGTFAFFEATEQYLQTYGKPLSIYVDKHSTFKINRQATIEEELRDTQAQTQYKRAM